MTPRFESFVVNRLIVLRKARHASFYFSGLKSCKLLYADITAFFDHMDFLCYGSVRSERGERYAALPCHSGEQQTFLGMKTWEFRQMDNE